MITVTNRKQYKDMPWNSYLAVPGYSFSWLKSEGQPVSFTPKMRLGKLVDQYLFTPHEYDGTMQDVVKPLALAVKSYLGDALTYATPQLAITADFTYEGLTMPYRGLIDLPVGKNLILDLKVSELDPVKAIQFFRYDWQTTGYSLGYGAKNRILMSINPKTKKITTLPIPEATDWWCHQIKLWGKPLN